MDASAIEDITSQIRAEKKKTKNIDDAVMKVVRKVFKETTPIRFEGNNYAESWVKEAAKRGLPNLRRAREGLAELTTKKAHNVLVGLGVLNDAELESRYHVRIERYIKDMLIEMHTLGEMVDTLVLPAVYGYAGPTPTAAPTAAGPMPGNTEQVGWLLYTNYLIPFEIASMLLLVAMIGAIVLAKREL